MGHFNVISHSEDILTTATQVQTLSADKVAHDQLRTALWYRMYQLTGVWPGIGSAGSEFYASLRLSQLFMTLAPWSMIAFRIPYPLFLALEDVLGPLLTGALVMNQLQSHSLQDLLSSVLYSRSAMFASLPPEGTGSISLGAHPSTRPTHFFPLHLRNSQQPLESVVVITTEDYTKDYVFHDHEASSARNLLSWNDACFDMEDPDLGRTITLQLEDCSVYTSPGGFNSDGSSLLSNDALEVAMNIAERIATFSDTPGPILTDIPFLFVHLTQQALSDLHMWLQITYGWNEDISSLLAPSLSAEVLAWEIIGFPLRPESLSSSPRQPIGNAQLGDRLRVDTTMNFDAPMLVEALTDIQYDLIGRPGLKVDATYVAPKTRRHLQPKTPLSITVYPNTELPLIEVITVPEDSVRPRRGRLVPKTEISIVVVPDEELATFQVVSSPLITVTPPRAPPPMTPSTPSKYLRGDVELDIGMASYQTWNGGKKSSIVAGLLTLGTLLSPLPRSPLGSLTSGLVDVRSPPPPKASILSPWLDVVHFHGLEPVQSPWIADHADAGAFSMFPQSPFMF